MARSIDRSFYKSKAWKITRESYLASKGGLCERCLAKGEIVPADIVHHKIWLSEENYLDPSISLNWKNLECLCQKCHNNEHFGGKNAQKRWDFDKDGRFSILS
jgi:5-methylcytosine-specific restriction endonuclease McrA